MSVAYRPPASDLHYMETLCRLIKDTVAAHPNCAHWFCGDYNLPDINWETESINSSQYLKRINETFLETLQTCDLTQVVDFPTRGENTLDILFTNRPTLVHRLTQYPGISDHNTIIQVEVDCRAQVKRPVKRKVHLWHKLTPAELSNIRKFVSNKSDHILQTFSTDSPVEDIWLAIKDISSSVLENFVPSKITSARFNQPWLTRKCRSLLRKKKRLYNRACRTNSPYDWQRFNDIRLASQRQCRSASRSYISDRVSTDQSRNNKFLFQYVKKQRTDNNGVSPLVDRGVTYVHPKDKANSLNRQFSSVFSPISNQSPDLGPQKHPSMPDIVISIPGVQKLLKNLKPNKAAGPDNIPAKFLKETAEELAPALTTLYKASLHQSKIPDDWRHARVSPLYKSGKNDRSKPANYRPISLTSISCKVMEHIICSNLMRHLDECDILTDFQHGFRRKRSCETQLVLTVDDLAKELDKGKQIDCILLDFAKAFDKVSHRSLIAKLKNYGVVDNNLLWIQDFLHSRSQVVVVEGEESERAAVTSGVPQGSVLGPALFLVYINDLPEKLHSTPRLFADDTLLYRVIDSEADCDLLQEDLATLELWERDWSMEFAAEKCMVLRITKRLERNRIIKNYQIHGHVLDTVDSAKYLGVTLDSKLSFSNHIQDTVKKANNTRQFLQRNISGCNRATKSLCYKAYVRPIVEYGSCAWDPHKGNQSQTDVLESVQRKSARFVCVDWRRTSSVSAMVANLHWASLQERRARARLAMFHKVQQSLVAIPKSLFTVSNAHMVTRGAPAKFHIPYFRTKVYQNSFKPAVVPLWNALPAEVATIKCHESFRSSLTAVRLCV